MTVRPVAESLDVDQTDTNEEHDCRQHRLGHVGEQTGQEEDHDEYDERHRHVGDLLAVLLVKDLGLGCYRSPRTCR
jgi:hypothetical protein